MGNKAMDYQNWRYLSLLQVDGALDICKPLDDDIETEYLVIGGGVAGLHAAQALAEKKCKVVLVEKSICGGGMSGRSGGFLTPDSELGLRQIEARRGRTIAKKIWFFGEEGQQSIVQNIKKNNFFCDLREQDSLLLGVGASGKKNVLDEYHDRQTFGLESEYITKNHLKQHNTGEAYTSGVRYSDCYAINPMQYCQALKLHLLRLGVRIYEFTHVHKIEKHQIFANRGSVRFKQAIICPGKAESAMFPTHSVHTYGIQNYIAMSEQLSPKQIAAIMPGGPCMCRDTKLVFNYYRLTGTGRLILGGGSALSSFQPWDLLYPQVIQGVIQAFKASFPHLQSIAFPRYWSGRIQASRDLMPLVGKDKRFENHTRVQGAVGLPRAAHCGRFATQLMHEEADPTMTKVLSYDRPFFIPRTPQGNVLKSIVFGLSNAKAMFG